MPLFELVVSYAHQKKHIQVKLPTNQGGYNESETTVGKVSGRLIQLCQVFFLGSIFHTSQNITPQKMMIQKRPRTIGCVFPRSFQRGFQIFIAILVWWQHIFMRLFMTANPAVIKIPEHCKCICSVSCLVSSQYVCTRA